jgi:hypothetical protein
MLRYAFAFPTILFFLLISPLFSMTVTPLGNGTAKIDNGAISVTWDEKQHKVTISQAGAFAVIEIPLGKTIVTAEHPVPGRNGQLINGATLVVRQEGENSRVELMFTLIENAPFVLMSTLIGKQHFAENEFIKQLEFPKITLNLPAEKHITLGTAGLRKADKHKGSYMFLAVADPENRSGVVSGWITTRKGSGIVFSEKTSDGNVSLKPVIEYGKLLPPKDFNDTGENISEVFVLGKFDDCRIGLERYAWQIARTHQIKMKPPVAGYCTWYAEKFGGACNETEIRNFTNAAAEKLSPFGFHFVQIDDKWQDGLATNGPRKNFTRVLQKEGKPDGDYKSGMKPAADYIRSKKMTAGLWLIPFAGTAEDPFWKQDFFVKDKTGKPFTNRWAGTSLDLSNPEVQQFLFNEIKTITQDWGYKYLKLDAYHAGMGVQHIYVNNEYKPDGLGDTVFSDPQYTPIAAQRKGGEIIRQAAGADTFLLGCNTAQNMRSFGAGFGQVDAMRIGPDNGPGWRSLKEGPWHGSNRYFLNGRVWWNDPDPVYVRNSMPLSHARLIASWVSISGQLYTFSDWLPNLSEERVEILRRTMRPHGLTSSRPVDLFNENLPKIWHLTTRSPRRIEGEPKPEQDVVAFYNWNDKEPMKIETSPKWIGLPEAAEYAAFDFWNNQFFGTFNDKLTVEVPAASCLILAVKPVRNHPVLLGTSQHVTQGIVDLVSVQWNEKTKTLSGVSRVIAGDPYELRIYDPKTKEVRRETLKPQKSSPAFKWNVKF